MNEKEKIEAEKRCSLIIHKQRLQDECIFQYIIKQRCLKDQSIEDMQNISRNIGTIIRNINHKFSKINVKINLDDEIANDKKWIINILKEKYILAEK